MKAIIVEDEYLSLDELKSIIEENSNIEVIDTFDNGLDALNFINKNYVDTIFLDINLPILDGMNLARTINKFEKKPKIIFITAYKKHAIEAFELDAFDYIMKPYSDERIICTLEKLEKEYEKEKIVNQKTEKISSKVTIREKKEMIVLDAEEIYMCQADDKETIVYTDNNKYLVPECLSEIYKDLPKDIFLKTHRSYIVNLNKIKKVISSGNSTYKLVLEREGLEGLVSRSHLKEFRERVGM